MLRIIAGVLASLALISAAALFYVVTEFDPEKNKFALEFSKSLLQVIVVVVIGSVLSLVTAQWNRQQDKQEKEQDATRSEAKKEREEEQRRAESRDAFRKEFVLRLHRAYAESKRAKRLLRALAFVPPYYGTWDDRSVVLRDPYDEHLQALNDVQLELEILFKELEATRGLFSRDCRIKAAIRGMESLLKKVITEYEMKRGGFSPKRPGRPISELPDLRDFVGRTSESKTRQGYTRNYLRAVKYMHRDIFGRSDG